MMIKNNTAFVVDDDSSFRSFLKTLLTESGYNVVDFGVAAEALDKVDDDPPSIVISDVMMPDMDGLALLKNLKKRWPQLPVIVTTGSGSVEPAVEAMKLGAFDYFVKPIDNERFLLATKNGIEFSQREQEVIRLRSELYDKYSSAQIIGKSPEIQNVMSQIIRVAASTVNVLLVGETGSGKGLVAKAIHYNSPRRDGPFIEVNAAAVPENLLESELFGHEKGAFTGAVSRRTGLFEQANGGTIFLDEIGDMPPGLQPKILKAVEEHSVTRVGGQGKIMIDVRVIAATNKNLEKAVTERQFREDLYYRINTLTIEIPPLRNRRQDIPLLANYFRDIFNKREGKDISGFDTSAMEVLLDHTWPGNVRELENCIAHAVLMSHGGSITKRDLPQRITGIDHSETTGTFSTPPVSLGELEILHIKSIVNRTNHNLSQAAKMLGIDYSTLHRKLKQYNIK
jgi:two-component system response regulator HydG